MLIQMVCSSTNTWQNHEDACNRFFEQSTKTFKLYQTDEKVENYYTVQAKGVATDTFGNSAIGIAGGMGYTYKVYRNKSIDFKLPTMGLADSASNHITPNSYSLNLSWKLPW